MLITLEASRVLAISPLRLSFAHRLRALLGSRPRSSVPQGQPGLEAAAALELTALRPDWRRL